MKGGCGRRTGGELVRDEVGMGLGLGVLRWEGRMWRDGDNCREKGVIRVRRW